MRTPLATALVVALTVTAAHGLECLDYGEYDRTILEHCDLAGATDLFRVGDLVYVVMVSDGMAIVDISDIDHPQTLAEVTTPGWSSAVAVAGTVAYVADDYSGVAVFDVSDPRAPTFVTSIDTGVTARDVLVDEGVLYAVGSELRISSLDDPLLPAFLASHDIVGVGYALAKDGDRLYLAGQSGLTVFDVSDPAHPTQLGHRALPHATECVTVGGDFAYLGGEYESLTVVDVGNPASPVVVATLDLDNGGLGVQLVGTDLSLPWYWTVPH